MAQAVPDAAVIERVGRGDMKALRAALLAEYKRYYGERRYWPYKVWCSEIRVQLGLKKFHPPGKKRILPPAPGQKELF